MDQTTPQQNPTIYINNTTQRFPKTILIFLLALVLGLVTGFIIRPLIIPQKTTPFSASQPPQSTQKPAIDESKLPISLSLLTNPIVGEWRGSVKGKLTKKDAHTFTLVDDQGNSITITDTLATGDKFKTVFFDKTNKNKGSSLSAIPVGSILIGDFWIFQNGPNTPVGSIFTKQ